MRPLHQKQQGTTCSVAQPKRAYTRSWPGSSARPTAAWKLLALPPSLGHSALSCAAERDTCNQMMLSG